MKYMSLARPAWLAPQTPLLPGRKNLSKPLFCRHCSESTRCARRTSSVRVAAQLAEIVGRQIDEFFSEARGEPIPTARENFVSEGLQGGIGCPTDPGPMTESNSR
jgi:hypothetical protein